MIDEPELLRLMLDDLTRQEGVYHPGPYWQGYARRIEAGIAAEGLASFRSSRAIARGYADVFAHPDAQLDAHATWWSRLSQARRAAKGASERDRHRERNLHLDRAIGEWLAGFRREHDLPDTTVGDPERRLNIAGSELGEIYLRVFAWISEYSKQVDFTKVESVLEIGGGFGAMAHALLHLFPNIKKYVYLDIPPVLYVGTQYLKHFFKDSVIDYRDTRSANPVRFSSGDKREIFALCPWQIETLDASIDLFWNSSSFQEMPQDVVRNYAWHAERLLSDRARVCFFVYEGTRGRHTLSSEEILEAIGTQSRFAFRRIETTVIDHILPGFSYYGERR